MRPVPERSHILKTWPTNAGPPPFPVEFKLEILTVDGNPELVDSDDILLADEDEAEGLVEEEKESRSVGEESDNDIDGRESGKGSNMLGEEETEFIKFGVLGMKIDEIFVAVDLIKWEMLFTQWLWRGRRRCSVAEPIGFLRYRRRASDVNEITLNILSSFPISDKRKRKSAWAYGLFWSPLLEIILDHRVSLLIRPAHLWFGSVSKQSGFFAVGSVSVRSFLKLVPFGLGFFIWFHGLSVRPFWVRYETGPFVQVYY